MRAIAFIVALFLLAGCAEEVVAPAKPPRTLVTMAPEEGSPSENNQTALQALSPEELRTCVARKQQAQQEDAQFALEDDDLHARRDALQAKQRALQVDRSAVTGTDRKAVDTYNARLRAIQADNDRFNVDISISNARRHAHGALVIAFNTECAGHSYYQDDMDEVLKSFPDVKL